MPWYIYESEEVGTYYKEILIEGEDEHDAEEAICEDEGELLEDGFKQHDRNWKEITKVEPEDYKKYGIE